MNDKPNAFASLAYQRASRFLALVASGIGPQEAAEKIYDKPLLAGEHAAMLALASRLMEESFKC